MDALPPELASRVLTFFKTLLRYCMDMLICEDHFSLPETVHHGMSAERLLPTLSTSIVSMGYS